MQTSIFPLGVPSIWVIYTGNLQKGAPNGVIKKLFVTFFHKQWYDKNFVDLNFTGVCPKNIF
jgi:hypothetical protein